VSSYTKDALRLYKGQEKQKSEGSFPNLNSLDPCSSPEEKMISSLVEQQQLRMMSWSPIARLHHGVHAEPASSVKTASLVQGLSSALGAMQGIGNNFSSLLGKISLGMFDPTCLVRCWGRGTPAQHSWVPWAFPPLAARHAVRNTTHRTPGQQP